MNYILIFSPFILILYQFIFLKICKGFQTKKKWIYIFPIILSYLFLIFTPDLKWYDIALSTSYMLLMDLSISDLLFREIDGKSYYFFIPLIGVILFAIDGPLWNIISLVISFVLMFGFFVIGHKMGEEMGGADMKLFMILSLFYPFDYVFTFLFYSLLFTLILAVICTIIKRSAKASIPIIVSITFGHIFISFCYLMLEKSLFRI